MSAIDRIDMGVMFSIFIIYVSWRRSDKKSVLRQALRIKARDYRKTHKNIAPEIPIALRINDSRTNLICQTKLARPTRPLSASAPFCDPTVIGNLDRIEY